MALDLRFFVSPSVCRHVCPLPGRGEDLALPREPLGWLGGLEFPWGAVRVSGGCRLVSAFLGGVDQRAAQWELWSEGQRGPRREGLGWVCVCVTDCGEVGRGLKAGDCRLEPRPHSRASGTSRGPPLLGATPSPFPWGSLHGRGLDLFTSMDLLVKPVDSG